MAKETVFSTPFDSLTLAGVVREWQQLLTDGQIQEVRQPTPLELHLMVRSGGQNYRLLFSADPQFARMHLTTTRKGNPTTPPAFCANLRKHLTNAVIRDIQQIDFDRIVQIDIEGRDENDDPIELLFVVELMGKHSNLVLVNSGGYVIDAIKRITHRINRFRETLPARPYIPPPAPENKTDPLNENALEIAADLRAESEDFAAALTKTFLGVSPFLAREIAFRVKDWDSLVETWNLVFTETLTGEMHPVFVQSGEGWEAGAYPFRIAQLSDKVQPRMALLNDALDEAYSQRVRQTLSANLSRELKGQIARALKHAEGQFTSLRKTADEADKAERYRQHGELILANVWKIEAEATEVVVQNYFLPDYPDETLSLDPDMTSQENAERLFNRYHKAKDAGEYAAQQLPLARARVEGLKSAQIEMEGLEEREVLDALRKRLLSARLMQPEGNTEPEKQIGTKSLPDFSGHKIKRVTTPDGYEILIGETATANDFLTTRVATPSDFWFHVRAAASSHVVLRTHGKPSEIPRAALLMAAQLCVKHSSQKHASLVSVDYTLKRFVRKPRGSAPGAADYEREITLHVSA
ncbi:MAG: NFACT family protein [Chthonomonadaceae bacterium]|nr:NFACT family protein [Chthonomonadaceae bacterium]